MRNRFLFIALVAFLVTFHSVSGAFAACAAPVANASAIIFNKDHKVLQYCDDTDWQAMGPPPGYVPNAVVFDGTNELLSGSLTGVTDSQQFVASFWVKPPTETATFLNIFDIGGARFHFAMDNGASNTNGLWTFYMDTNTPQVFEYESAEVIPENQWTHILISGDASSSTLQVYINSAVDTPIFSAVNSSNTVDFTRVTSVLGSFEGGGTPFSGAIADFWFETGTYIDLSAAANRRKFIDAAGNPVNLGTDGSNPTGSAPDIFLSGDTATWHTNKGTGGGFTENGALTDAATAPGGGTSIVPTGLVGHWKLDETSGTGIIDYASSNNGTVQGGLDPATDSVQGRLGTALNFDGSADDISIGNVLGFDNTDSFSIAVWYKADFTIPAGIQSLVAKFDQNSPFKGYVLMIPSGSSSLSFNLVSDGGGPQQYIDVEMPRPADNEWHHVVITYDGSSLATGVNGYVNGQSQTMTVNRNTLSGSITNSVALTIGSRNSVSRFFDGSIDDVRIYNRALTAEDVAEIYRSRDGNIDYNADARVPEYFNGENWMSMGHEQYIPNAVAFDGANDYLVQNSTITGATDTKLFTFSFWARRDVDNPMHVFTARDTLSTEDRTTLRFTGVVGNAEQIRLHLYNSSKVQILDVLENGVLSYDGGWHHYMGSFDLSSTARRHLYVDGINANPFYGVYSDDTIDVSGITNFYTGIAIDVINGKFDGNMADLWVDYGTYIDLSQVENRQKFIDANGKPVYLGPSGSIPTGTAPDVFLSGDTATWHTNKGTGGGFTENGALTDALTKPNWPYFPTDGLVSYWKMDEISGSAVIDYASGNNGTYSTGPRSGGPVIANVVPTSGVYGGALGFDASVQYSVDLGDNSDFDFSGTNAFTISAWVLPSERRSGQIFSRGDTNSGAANTGIQFGTNATDPDRWEIRISDGTSRPSVPSANDTVALNEWQHMVFTWDGTDMILYKNAVSIASSNQPGFALWNGATINARNTAIGASGRSLDHAWTGKIDDVAVYNRALTAPEISAIYASAKCTNPERMNGTLIYNSDLNVMQYCDGEQWRRM